MFIGDCQVFNILLSTSNKYNNEITWNQIKLLYMKKERGSGDESLKAGNQPKYIVD